MTPTECVQLVRLVKAIAPAQAFDEMTPDMWQPILADIPLADALEALKTLGQRLRFIAPADIVAEVKVIRAERLKRAEATFRYLGDPDDVAEYQRQLQAHRKAIGDGAEPITPVLERGRPTDRELQSVFRRVPRALEVVRDKPAGEVS